MNEWFLCCIQRNFTRIFSIQRLVNLNELCKYNNHNFEARTLLWQFLILMYCSVYNLSLSLIIFVISLFDKKFSNDSSDVQVASIMFIPGLFNDHSIVNPWRLNPRCINPHRVNPAWSQKIKTRMMTSHHMCFLRQRMFLTTRDEFLD